MPRQKSSLAFSVVLFYFFHVLLHWLDLFFSLICLLVKHLPLHVRHVSPIVFFVFFFLFITASPTPLNSKIKLKTEARNSMRGPLWLSDGCHFRVCQWFGPSGTGETILPWSSLPLWGFFLVQVHLYPWRSFPTVHTQGALPAGLQPGASIRSIRS